MMEWVKDMNMGNAVLNYARDYVSKTYHAPAAERALKVYQDICRNISSKYSDSVEISQDGYELQEQEKNLSASSGKDQLGITKGTAPNSYVIHFDNVALAHRAVQRGYITVNGQDIPLSDEVKEKILKTSKEAFDASEKAMMQYIMQHNAIVARQQAEVWENESKRMSRAMSVMSKMASGEKVSEEDRKFLAEYDPEMYAMAVSAEMMAERKEKREEKQFVEIRGRSKEQTPSEDYAKELGNLQCEHTEATLEVSFENGNAITGEIGTNTINY